jgi:hypothetical protein
MTPVDVIRSFEGVRGASLGEQAEALTLTIHRGSISVLLTVPKSVLEWFVDVRDEATARSVTDWCDYAGYDDTPDAQLSSDMADDLQSFVGRLLERPLRFVARPGVLRGGFAVEWELGGQWEQAVPLAEPALAADVRKDARG